MTAPALPRDDQAAEQAFDIELESLMDGDVRCQVCEDPATHALVHGGPCQVLMCDAHAGGMRRFLAGHRPTGRARCLACGNAALTLADFHIRPI